MVELWDTWNVRVLVILSLLTQVFLLLLAPCRKRRGGKGYIQITIWFAYLFADWVAVFTIGLILQAGSRTEFQILWAPFLLLHLGGPDTITAFSLEDNEFWLRHLIGLLLQVGSTLYVIGQSRLHNKFWVSTFLILIAGTIKYVERNLSFYFASFDRFGDNEIWDSNSSESPPESSPKKLTWKEKFKYWVLCRPHPMQFTTEGADDSYLQEGWRYVRNGTLLSNFLLSKEPYRGTIKFLLVGPLISPNRRDLSRICFLRIKSSKAMLRMIETELNLLYEALHTKFPLFESKLGKILRIVSLSCIIAALLSFLVFVKRGDGLKKLDVCLTYALLIGAIAIDFISIGLVSISDFHNFQPYWKFGKFLSIKSMCRSDQQGSYWSKEVSQLSFLTYYVDSAHTIWWEKLGSFPTLRLTLVDAIIGGKKYKFSKEFNENQECWAFIVRELMEKAESAETVEEGKKICLRKGEGPILKWLNIDEQSLQKQEQTKKELIWSFLRLDYTESFLSWHIATELCFRYGKIEDNTKTEENNMDYRSIAKVISCYMFYLFETQHPMIASVFIDSKALREGTCNHVQRALYYYGKSLEMAKDQGMVEDEEGRGRIKYVDRNDNDYERYVYEEGRRVYATEGVSGQLFAMTSPNFEGMLSKSALENARRLVDELEEKDGTFPWKLISQVWVEIMCYASINCKPNIHAQQPSQGGQLLTFVWLLMNNLGLGTNFSQDN